MTEETTSPVRQELDLRRFAVNRGCHVAGVAKGLNVSATRVPPQKRPKLGDWINNRAPEFDQILFWKLDRFVRRISDLNLMTEWCREYDKVLAADKDPIGLDSAYGEMMVTMIAGMARIEAANTGVRLESLWKYARTTDRWVIGKPTYGYTTGEGPDGRRLIVQPFRERVLRWIYAMLMRGRSMYKITQIVNRAGVPTPNGGKWYARNLTAILTNPALKGVRVIRPPEAKSKDISRIVYGADGQPIRLAPAIFTDEESGDFEVIHREYARAQRTWPASRSYRNRSSTTWPALLPAAFSRSEGSYGRKRQKRGGSPGPTAQVAYHPRRPRTAALVNPWGRKVWFTFLHLVVLLIGLAIDAVSVAIVVELFQVG